MVAGFTLNKGSENKSLEKISYDAGGQGKSRVYAKIVHQILLI